MINVIQDQPIIWRKLNCFYSLLLHIIEGMMNETNLINNDKIDDAVPVEIVAKGEEKNHSKKINSTDYYKHSSYTRMWRCHQNCSNRIT